MAIIDFCSRNFYLILFLMIILMCILGAAVMAIIAAIEEKKNVNNKRNAVISDVEISKQSKMASKSSKNANKTGGGNL